ncbi:hypothetical protein Pmar_PMAR005105 [Perkinsus marinus ATCC 50983]|uniref:Uncharacterized protein n=1 Tax=Perkinsus marinus (strain ATCC 50983 / TXsc) TaxID=423536 RepID=C5KAM4_PERM5|nr:hypothetical protein Pmar_PMAR005105 [Perkinsus marinus ATCC 50983]EER18200.1 hypothetical protein Pmar_PMAR005105 [Perkinsus marinus ATCC 50983]|eukprot:XP_002786404.1 hypothetical protein Pmar_PMAR005105 [Perkinsus marinus ATCC 50983]
MSDTYGRARVILWALSGTAAAYFGQVLATISLQTPLWVACIVTASVALLAGLWLQVSPSPMALLSDCHSTGTLTRCIVLSGRPSPT